MTCKVIRVHSDRGGEFVGGLVLDWLSSQLIWATTTEGHDPAANGAAEAAVNLVKRGARALLLSSGLSTRWWGLAVLEAAAAQRRAALKTPPPPVQFGARVFVTEREAAKDAFCA